MLEKLKLFLGVEGEEENALLSLSLDLTEEMIQNYCNRTEVPAGLNMVWVRMAADIYQNELAAGGNGDGVASISLGDAKVSFGSQSAQEQYQEGILKNYRVQLNRYRRLGF